MKSPSKWIAPSGTGTISQSGGLGLSTLSGVQLTTLSGVSLITDTLIYSPKSLDQWTLTGKNQSKWLPNSGQGYVIDEGAQNFIDNLGDFIVDNNGNFLVTTPLQTIPKYPSLWTESGA